MLLCALHPRPGVLPGAAGRSVRLIVNAMVSPLTGMLAMDGCTGG